MKKKMLALLLALTMVFSMAAVASASEVVASGHDWRVDWVLTDDGVLTISGDTYMRDDEFEYNSPWSKYMDEVTSIVIEEGVYGVAHFAFTGFENVTEVSLPESLETIAMSAFAGCSSLERLELPAAVQKIGDMAFSTCPALKTLIFCGDAPQFGDAVFGGDELTVWYPADNATWTEEIMQNYGGTVTWQSNEPLDFTDVPLGSFYYDSVSWAVENNITNGLTATEFGPTASCNRAHVVTFLWRSAGCPEPTSTENPFVDVKEGDFFHKAVLWAVENGITNGIDATHFGPSVPCNRAQVVTFLYRAMQSPAVGTTACPFTDVVAGQWYEPAVLWAVENGITNGLSADTFGVDTTCNRAQVVTFLYRTYVN